MPTGTAYVPRGPATAEAADHRPDAARLKFPTWRDPRLVVGLVLVVSSVAGTWWLVARASTTVPVYAAAADLPAGTTVGPGDVETVAVHLGDTGGHYLGAGQDPTGRVLAHSLTRGELVPAAALEEAGTAARRPVTVPVEGGLPTGVRRGATVDVWASAPGATAGTFRAPRVVREGVAVASVHEDRGALGTRNGSAVEILVPDEGLADVLTVLADGSRITLVPAPAREPGEES